MERMFFQSTWHETVIVAGKPQLGRKLKTATYVKPKVEGEVKGKLNRKHAARQKVRAMQAAGHFKGDNRPFAMV